jgi:hypothetical protein
MEHRDALYPLRAYNHAPQVHSPAEADFPGQTGHSESDVRQAE